MTNHSPLRESNQDKVHEAIVTFLEQQIDFSGIYDTVYLLVQADFGQQT